MGDNYVVIPDFHAGNLIISFLKNNHIPQAHLARELDMATPNLNRLLKRDSIDTELLRIISEKLRHNFFADISGDVEEGDYFALASVPVGQHIEKRIKELQMTQSQLASILKVTPAEVSRLLKKESFDAQKLLKISRILNYNFFQDFYNFSESTEFDENSIVAVIKRYEEKNERMQKAIDKMASEIAQLRKKLEDAGIDNDS